MRRIMISLLLASAAASPATAGPHNWSSHQSASDDQQSTSNNQQSAHEEHQAAREERQAAREEARSERSNNSGSNNSGSNNSGRQQNAAPPAQVGQQSFTGGGGERFNGRPDRGGGAANYVAPGARAVNAPNSQDREQLRAQRIQDRDARQAAMQSTRDQRQSERQAWNGARNRPPVVVSNTPRPGTQPPLRTDNYRHGGSSHWNTSWRHDHRYNWHGYRNHHRSLFHLGFYYDPYGWDYQPFSIGLRLWPSYYGRNFWINDPWMYRLPYAPPGLVWVRYWNDALLVDTWSGTVVDVIPGFFW